MFPGISVYGKLFIFRITQITDGLRSSSTRKEFFVPSWVLFRLMNDLAYVSLIIRSLASVMVELA